MKSRFFWEELKKFACLLIAMMLIISLTVGDYTGSSSLTEISSSAEETTGTTTVSFSDITDSTGTLNFSNLQVSNFSSEVTTASALSASTSTSNYETRTIIVSFEEDSLLDGADGADVETYAATTAGKKAAAAIEKTHKDFYQALSSEGIEYSKVYSYSVVDNAVAIEIDTSFVSDIKNMDGVESVVIGETYSKPETTTDSDSTATTNATSVYATGIYDSSTYVEEYGGKGMTVAILDTGLDYTHEAFRLTTETDDPYYNYSQYYLDGTYYLSDGTEGKTLSEYEGSWSQTYVTNLIDSGALNASGDVYVSAKVPFAFDYSDNDDDVYPSYSNHGTHVAGIIAGRAASYSDSDGNLVYKDGYSAANTYTVKTASGTEYISTKEGSTAYEDLATEEFIGVAPYAQLVICKVFTDDLDDSDVGGATTEDILAALEDCVTLGVDVINMSLGSTNGFSSTNDGDSEGELMSKIYNDIGTAGISLVVAASNDYSSGYGSTFGTNLASNPDSGTVGSPSTYSSAISVASISGKMSSYLLSDSGTSVFFRESADENSVDYDFIEQMFELATSGTENNSNYYLTYDDEGALVRNLKIMYVVIPGVGQSTDYTSTIKKYISQGQENGYLVVALVKRGTTTFQDKVEMAMTAGADGVMVYNNVAGEIKMTIGDIDDPIPTISITQVAGQALVDEATSYVGYLTISDAYEAGPFMSEFSSWGTTSDLKLKPEITAHGGEITSSVPGGYTEMSGTSMATPNVSGLMANILSYVKQNYSKFFGEGATYDKTTATKLAYQLMMSTATIVYDADGYAYSPRKQGAGLASLDNLVSTNAYLSTLDGQKITSAHASGGYYIVDTDGRPKIELGEDENKVGEYTLVYYINNVSSSNMSFKLNSLFFTESLSLDGLAVAQQAYMLDDNAAVWTINGTTYHDGDVVSFASGTTMITCTLSLSDAEKAYLDESFVNGMYVEGFLQLISTDEAQCDLSIPFMGFYGDWESAPMLDYDAYEIAEIEADTSIDDEDKASETVWATQAYTMYWNDSYVLPMGSFLYNQDEYADQIYASEEYCSISCYNDTTAGYYNDATAVDARSDSSSYMTSYAIKGLYAGLLRNAKYVYCTMYDATTGEQIYFKEVYRVGKAYAGGGSASPAYVKLELTPEELGLVENGTYTLEFIFYFQSTDEEVTEDNTFSFSFTVDYTAPVLESASVRYVDYKENNISKQRVYLDLSVYDNHYAMAALLCYLSEDANGDEELILATDYVTPIYKAVKNGTSTVSIEITELMELIEDGLTLYLELDDYALNHSIYAIDIDTASSNVLPDTFTVDESTNSDGNYAVTIGRLETYTISLDWDTETYSSANLSNFTWKVLDGYTDIIAVKNGEIIGLEAGTGVLTVSGNGTKYNIYVTVTANSNKLSTWPTEISFGTMYNSADVPVTASGTVTVNIEQSIQLSVEYTPWYYDLVSDDYKTLTIEYEWSSSDPTVATVDQNGNVTLLKKGSTTISAGIKGTSLAASVSLSVQEAFTVSSTTLTKYVGAGGVVYIPTDMNITTIGDEAFKDNTSITAVVIPKSVTTISEDAFSGCTNLEYIFFDDIYTQDIADCELTLIEQFAFEGCTALKYIDFSNCKTFTVAKYAFYGCSSLQVIKGIENIGTAYNYAFAGCSSLIGSLSADSGVELVNSIVYKGSYSYQDDNGSVQTATETVSGISGLKQVVSSTHATDIKNVKLILSETATETDSACTINIKSMSEIVSHVTSLDVTGLHVSGDYVFANCDSLIAITTGEFTSIGYGMFYNCDSPRLTSVTISTSSVGAYAFFDCDYLTDVTFSGVTNATIGNYAFAADGAGNLNSVTFTNSTVKSIGDYAFKGAYMDEFELPEGLTSLGEDLFNLGRVTTLTLTTDISGVTFTGTTFDSVDTISLDTDNTTVTNALDITDNLLYTKDGYGKKVKVLLALNGTDSYTIADTVTEIGSYAFANKEIASITIPSGVTTIGDYAFSGSALTSVIIPASVTTIGEGAFYNCGSLETITFEGSALTTIGSRAFMSTEIETISVPSSVTSVGSYAFADTPIQTFNYTPTNTVAFGSYVFANCTYLESITLADNITTMGDGTFYGCTALETANLPSVTSLGWYTFYGCSALTTASFGSSATTTGDYTFYYCTALTSATIGGSTSEIGTGVFALCTSLEAVDIKNATVIDSYAFYGCTALKTVTGLGNAKNIGSYAFYSCPLTTVDISSAQVIGDFAFYGNAATEITIPATLASTTTETVKYVDGAAYDIEITEQYKYTYASLGYGAFAGATKLTKFTVASGNKDYFTDNSGVLYRVLSDGSYELMAYPSALTETSYSVLDDTVRINAYAFADLTAGTLETVTLPYELATIGTGAFSNSGVTSYTFTSYVAPTLEAEVSYETDSDSDDYNYYITYLASVAGGVYRGLYYTNFEEGLINYAPDIVYAYSVDGESSSVASTTSSLAIIYPSNGTGYTNFVYSNYFGSTTTASAVLSTASYTVYKNLTGSDWYSVETINGWLTAEITEELTATVTEFSELVKATHLNYNNMKSDETQVTLLTAKLADSSVTIDLLTETEEALSAVKTRFGIVVSYSSARVSSDYKSEYVVGEYFDMTGLEITVTYDDYSEQVYTYADGELELVDTYKAALETIDNVVYVTIKPEGRRVGITITVTDGTASGGTASGGSSGLSTGAIIGISVGAAVVVLAAAGAVVAVLLIKKKKLKANNTDGSDVIEVSNDISDNAEISEETNKTVEESGESAETSESVEVSDNAEASDTAETSEKPEDGKDTSGDSGENN